MNNNHDTQIVILCGGQGNRFLNIDESIPKCLYPIKEKAFIRYMIEQLQSQGFIKFTFLLGDRYELFIDEFKEEFNFKHFNYILEETPLGTGGAILNFFNLNPQYESILVINGDTFIKEDFERVIKRTEQSTILLCNNFKKDSASGAVQISAKKILSFNEKSNSGSYLNTGIYLLNRNLFHGSNGQFSLEKNILEPNISSFQYVVSSNLFYDIGTTEGFERTKLYIESIT
ncbi:sugar phosphate nucleotidyltransferase [Halobacteriovorax sp. HLS]|uniref:sugar phosphate nucleotidyltransferase n=1 Tax=Halobacteriovorax sp. HLS TaxID=2234000 RepID=UPI000FDB7FE1|nr:sugar phosphate nucleotidyltransferase [Halobacteriovorax sp. HLS]